MTTKKTDNIDFEVTAEENEKLDASLLEIQLLYKSRCVQAPGATNVIVREVENKDK